MDTVTQSRELMELPKCPRGHGYMVLVPAWTPEQAWVGVHYRCAPSPANCMCSVILPSPELTASLERQRAVTP